MILGEFSVFVWVLGAMLIGFVGFFVMILTFLARLLGMAFRGITGGRRSLPKPPQAPRTPAARAGPNVICPHPRCGHINARRGVYCARCGRPINRSSELDAYG
jgi:hypothetical protein